MRITYCGVPDLKFKKLSDPQGFLYTNSLFLQLSNNTPFASSLFLQLSNDTPFARIV